MGYWSEASLRDYEPSDKATCAEHILDDSLVERLQDSFTEDVCSFCDVTGQGVAVDLDALLNIGMEKVHEEFSPAADYGPMLGDLGLSYEGGYDTGDALEYIFDGALSEGVVAEIRACANDQVWVLERLLYFDDQQRMAATWEAFVNSVKHHRRFWFSELDKSEQTFSSEQMSVIHFFDQIGSLLTRPDIATMWPTGSTIWRGRMVAAEKDPTAFDGKQLGSPPDGASAANRMSPAGISMFYGGDTPDVVVAEIGAHSTENHAVYGAFTTLRDLRIVDLTNLPPVPDYFATDNSDRLVLEFLRDFVADLVKPVILDGREHIDYVPTQIVTEYLRNFSNPAVDGLRFASSQHSGGINSVLFCDWRRCVNPPGSDLDQAGWPDPGVLDEVQEKFPHLLPWLQFDPDTRAKVKTKTTIAGPV
jgi:hypothetical protein